MAAVSVDNLFELSLRSSLCHARNSRTSALASSKRLMARPALQAHRCRQLPASPRCFAPSSSLTVTSASLPSPRHPASLRVTEPGRSRFTQAARKVAVPALSQKSRRESPGDEEGLEYTTWRKEKGSGSDSDSGSESDNRNGGSSSSGNGSAALHDMEYLEGRQSLKRATSGRVDASLRNLVRPKRIILVRHGESEGNVDESAYTRIPDSRIALTQKGWDQAKHCGEKIRELIESDGEEDWKVYFYVSPYMRTIQTVRGLGLPFERRRIAGVREEPRIREQDFGNFQCREKMRVEKEVRLRYGRFFYRFADGESAADVYDRVTGFRETLRADIEVGRFQRSDFSSRNMNIVLVSHGLTLRVFLMRWYKWSVQQFEGLYNFNNAQPLVMQRGEHGRYSLSIHHSREELKKFGMTEAMIRDQEWQISARPGELNNEWSTSGPGFFDHFDEEEQIIQNYVCEGLSEGCTPEEIIRAQL